MRMLGAVSDESCRLPSAMVGMAHPGCFRSSRDCSFACCDLWTGSDVIRETTGDILEADVEALVNPVNTVGVMGAGLALRFKHKYPEMYQEYRVACRQKALDVGYIKVHQLKRLPGVTQPRMVISFPTKRHWQKPSRLEWVDQGLVRLRGTVEALQIRSIAIPPLGCGLGGLNWADVRGLIGERLGDLDVDMVLYGPKGGD
jgi:O-acetyl-ADP-ribose deacetylase (regulator of RNase III)